VWLCTVLSLGLLGLRVAHGYQLADDKILFIEPLFPASQCIHLLGIQVLQRVERPIQIFGQHVLVEAAARQTSRGISASKVCVGAAGAVEVAAGGDIKDTAADGYVDWHVVEAIVGEERGRSEGAEDGWRRSARERLRGRWPEAEVDKAGEEREEDQVDGCEDRSAAGRS
jgi:hypothetical protein